MSVMNNGDDFRYGSLFRQHQPSTWRLAFLYLASKGVRFDNMDKEAENWDLIFKTAKKIANALNSKNKKVKKAHEDLLNARTHESIFS